VFATASTGTREFTSLEANPSVQQFTRILDESVALFYEFPVRIHSEARLFAVCFDEHFVVPLTIRIIFFDYLDDLSACRLFFNCLLDRCGERL
jgi:hypothetical protein